MVKRVFLFCMNILRIENELACTYQALKTAINTQAHTVGDAGLNPVRVSVKALPMTENTKSASFPRNSSGRGLSSCCTPDRLRSLSRNSTLRNVSIAPSYNRFSHAIFKCLPSSDLETLLNCTPNSLRVYRHFYLDLVLF